MPPRRSKSKDASSSKAPSSKDVVVSDSKLPQQIEVKKNRSYVCCRVFFVTFGTYPNNMLIIIH